MELEHAEPKGVGMDARRLSKALKALEDGLDGGLYPGAACIVGRRGKVVLEGALGHLDLDSSRPAAIDSIFDLASLTKPIATATMLLLLLEDGRLHLGESIDTIFPERRLPHLSEVTLRHLLTHTSGLPAWRDMYSDGQSREQLVDILLSIPLDNRPGSKYTYSCLGYIMLGLAIEKIGGISLDEFAESRIFRPLRMFSTGFNPGGESAIRIAATANSPARKRALVGEVHDSNAWAMGGVSGNAGLFSCLEDLARYCQMLLDGGMYAGRPLLSTLTSALIFRNLLHSGLGQTAGWFIHPNDKLPAGDLLSESTIGHSGFTGTSVVIDPRQELYAVLLTNRVCRDDDGMAFRRLRRVFHNLVGQAIISKQ